MSYRPPQQRFVISAFPQPVQLDPHFATNTWQTLKSAIIEINNRNTFNLSFEQLYRFSYNMVLHKHGHYLYQGLTNLQTHHLQTVAALIQDTQTPQFLPQIQRQWLWFELSLAHVRDVLMYMDRNYVKPNHKKTVHDLGLSLFRDVVIRNTTILPRLSEMLLNSIDRERSGEPIDTLLVKSITRMLAQLGQTDSGQTVYACVFEDGFLERTRTFYAREATLYLAETTCSEYLRKASQRIQEERMRVETYLQLETAPKVRNVAETQLISNYMDTLVNMENSGLIWMLRNDKLHDLRLMYTLFKDIKNGEDVLRDNLKKELLERGNQLVSDQQNAHDPIALINSILQLKQKYDNIVNTAFTIPQTESTAAATNASRLEIPLSTGNTLHISPTPSNTASAPHSVGPAGAALQTISSGDAGAGSTAGLVQPGQPDKKFVSAVNDAFERFVNSFHRSSEYISLYVDKLLRKDFKASTDDEIDAKLDSVMTLFRYLNEKDVFERYFKLHLTKRLLHAKSASTDAERLFISKIKTECGYMYTAKMEVMFNDMKTSDDTCSAFREEIVRQGTDMKAVDLNVAVLTTMSWPINQAPDINLPELAVYCTKQFENFYYNKHEGRLLTWQPFYGTAEIRATFGNGTRVVDLFSVSAYSMCILMLFNDHDCLTYKQIQEQTRIQDDELIRHLQSLSLAKYRVLRKEPMEKEVKPEDKFYFNDDFKCRNRRIKMQVVTAQKENEAERNQTKCRIDADRRPVIDTVVVRIMKHRKVLEHNKLIVEVTKQLVSRFEPNPQEIKKRIESLVEREYLERQKDRRQVYQYVA